ncbi:MAG: hypothetical protein AAF437_15620 [Pseudomonadota bacterium]
MKLRFKLLGLCAGLIVALPSASALKETRIEVAFQYDSAIPAKATYRKAERTAIKACGLNGRVLPIKRTLKRTCVDPLVEEFVIATGNPDLRAHHEKRTGRAVGSYSFAAN